MFLPSLNYLYLSEKIFNAFFAETEDALAKFIFLMANKCLSWLYYCLLIANSFSTVPRQKQKDQLALKLALANYWCKYKKTDTGVKRARPSRIQLEYEKKIKRNPTKAIPDADIRRD